MKHTFSLAVLIIFFLANSFGQDNNNIDRSLCSKNKIRSIKVYEYKYRNAKLKGRCKLLFYWIYDTTGLLSEDYFYGGFPVGTVHDTYKYDNNGNRTGKSLYKYDDKNRIIEKEISNFGGKWYYTYDSLGNQTRIKWYWFGETKQNSYFLDSFEYNDKNRITKMVRYKADKSIYFYKTYDYDSVGNMTKEIRFEKSDTTDIWTNQYDQSGNRIENKSFDKRQNKIIAWYKTSYDNKGLIINEIGKLSHEDKQYYRKYIYEHYD